MSYLLRLAETALFAVAVSSCTATGEAAPSRTLRGPGVSRLSVRGREVLAPDGRPIRLRGFNVLWWANPDEQAASDIVELGANCVRYMFGYEPSGRFEPEKVAFVRDHVRTFTSRGLWVFVTVHRFERKQGEEKLQPWDSGDVQREFLDMWTYVIRQLRNDPLIAGWEPLNEPHDVDGETLAKWYRGVVARLRGLDPRTPVAVDCGDWSNPWGMGDYLKLDAPNVIYSFHMYSPHDFTHQEPDRPTEYPGQWGREYLARQIAPAVEFREKFDVPVWCGEWGCITRARGHEGWLGDVASILEEHGFHWTHWAWVVKAEPVNDTFDVNKHKTGIYNVLAGVLAGVLREAAGGDPVTPRPAVP